MWGASMTHSMTSTLPILAQHPIPLSSLQQLGQANLLQQVRQQVGIHISQALW